MTTMPTVNRLGAAGHSDVEDAAVLAFELLKELGFSSGSLVPADLQPVVAPLVRGLNLRVATPERLERERDDAAHLDYIEAIHAARAGVHLQAANAIAARTIFHGSRTGQSIRCRSSQRPRAASIA